MADNATSELVVADGAVFATDDIGGIHFPIGKITIGALNSQTLLTGGTGTSDAGTIRVTLATDIALPTGTNEIGNVKNSGTFAVQSTLQTGANTIGKVNIGAADVGAGDLAKAEDAVHASGDVGVMSLGVRNDALAPVAADGDYVPFITDEVGATWSHNVPSDLDAGNSSTTPLGVSATFTGTGVDILDYTAVTIFVDSDVDSATDGIQLELSSDNVNWDVSRAFNYVAASGGRLLQMSAAAKFFRVVYTNGTTGQATFRLQTILHHSTPVTATTRLVDDEDSDTATVVIKSAVIAQKGGTGDFIPIQSTMGGSLKISIEEANGNIQGGGTEATALRVTMATDSTGLLSVDDNGGSLTVDNATLDTVGGGTEAAAQRVTIASDSTGLLSVDDNGGSLTIDNTALDTVGGGTEAAAQRVTIANDSTGVVTVDNTVLSVVGGGTEAAAQRVTLANDSTGLLSVDNDGTFATQATLQAGSASIGTLGANDGVDIGDVDVTSIAAGTNLIGDVGLSGTRTTGGTTLYKNIDVDVKDEIKATGGQVYWIHAINQSASPVYLKFYDLAAASVTVGTTVPDLTFPVPTTGDTNGAGFTLSIPNGIAFGTGITIAGTGLIDDNDNTALGTNALVVSIGFA